MTTLAIIGGTGLTRMDGLTVTRREMVKTPYGAPSCPLVFGELGGQRVAFLARHGSSHSIPPHRVNYCANIWALHSVGITRIIAVAAVGGIASDCTVGSIVVPDQIIDYTHGRESTFFDGGDDPVEHIDFSYPYDDTLRRCADSGLSCRRRYLGSGAWDLSESHRAHVWKPLLRLHRMAQAGCTIVGMTGMPEAALAAELRIAYACCGVVVNPAAGTDNKPVDTDAMPGAISAAMEKRPPCSV